MLRSLIPQSLLALLLLTNVACTQAPAQIDLKGQNSYNRNGSSTSYASNASSYSSYQPSAGSSSYSNSISYNSGASSHTDSTAAISSIGVSDLSPPSSGTPATNKGAVTSQNAKPLASDNVNPWTHSPRSMNGTAPATTTAASSALDESFHLSPKGQPPAAKQQMVSDVKPLPAPTKTTALDSIVSNEDSGPVVKESASVKKSKKADMASSSAFMWPVNSKKIISDFGPKGKGKVNDGINIASAAGEPVWAAADGEVVYVGNELQGYGNIVIIKHTGDKTTTYAHLNRYTVDKYDRIKQGDIIGYVGNTGNVKDPQLHFAIRDGKDAVDPMKYLGQNVASLR